MNRRAIQGVGGIIGLCLFLTIHFFFLSNLERFTPAVQALDSTTLTFRLSSYAPEEAQGCLQQEYLTFSTLDEAPALLQSTIPLAETAITHFLEAHQDVLCTVSLVPLPSSGAEALDLAQTIREVYAETPLTLDRVVIE